MNRDTQNPVFTGDKVAGSLQYLGEQITTAHDSVLLELIDQGWEKFYRIIHGDRLVDVFDSLETGDHHHTEAVEWHWGARLALLRGEPVPSDHWAYFPTWSRGNLKTSIGRAMLVTDALMTYAYGQRGYALIPGGTNAKIKGTAMSIEKALHTPAILKYCPALSRVERNYQGRSRGWTADFIATEAGYIFHFIGLDEGVAGANVDDVRPTIIMPDDIDTRDQSPVIAESRFKTFTTEVLPTRQANTLVYWAQNLINRFSVRYRVEKQHVKVLTNRKPTKPVPAVRGLVHEQRTVDGIVKDVVLAGNPTWRGWTLQRVQQEIDTYGLPAFMAECMHEVEQSTDGLLLHAWRDAVHVISESEFASVFGTPKMPPHWPKEWGNDWARTKTKFHANVAAWRTVSPQNSALPGFNFLFQPMSFPANSPPEDVAERVLGCLEKGPIGVWSDAYRRITPVRGIEGKTWQMMRRDELIRTNAIAYANTDLERMEFERDALAGVFPRYTEAVLKKHNVLGGVNSHERDDIRKIYAVVYGLPCRGVNPKKFGGIEQINRDLAVDYDTPHPFRPAQGGFTRTFLVVPDNKEADPRFVDDSAVYPPKPFTDSISPEELHDDDLFRYQMVNWRTRPATLTVTGQVIDEPEKLNDDFGNMLQMLYENGPLKNQPLTVEEEWRSLVPDEMMPGNPDIPMTHNRQQQLHAALYCAQLQLEEKYGREELYEEMEAGEYADVFD